MKTYIYIDKAQFYAYHGVLSQEKTVGNTFFVSLTVEVDVTKATASDKLEDTLSYAEIYDVVKKEMAVPSNLLEHVAGRILNALRSLFPTIGRIDISVTKKNPPVVGQTEGMGVRIVSE